ncbi:MAG: hypothetical protein R3D51_17660 [Hyphomicrobiaceae bacterium]
MKSTPPLTIEGYTPAEIAAMEDVWALAICGEPIVHKVGEANILAQFSVLDRSLITEPGATEGGGDGTLRTLIDAIERCARSREITAIDWRVYAVDCTTPNPKLIRVLEYLGFKRAEIQSGAIVYRRKEIKNRGDTQDLVIVRNHGLQVERIE